MRLGARQLYLLLLGGVGVTVMALIACTYVANGLLQKQSQAVLQARTDGLVLDEKQRRLTRAKADVEKYRDLAEIAGSIVPQDKDQAQTVRELVTLAQKHNIKLGAITFPTSSLGDPKTPLSQLKAVQGIPGVYSLDITVQSDAKTPAQFEDFTNFLDALEHNRRTALVDNIAIQPEVASPSKLSFTLTLSEYIKP